MREQFIREAEETIKMLQKKLKTAEPNEIEEIEVQLDWWKDELSRMKDTGV